MVGKDKDGAPSSSSGKGMSDDLSDVSMEGFNITTTPDIEEMELEEIIGGNREQVGVEGEEDDEEISKPPRGSSREKVGGSPEFPENPEDWIKAEVLLEEIWEKKRVLKGKDDNVKDFTFPGDPSGILRPYSVWQIPEVCALKKELNEVKAQVTLNQFPADLWHSHANRMDIANTVMAHVTKYFNPEYCGEDYDWAKMFDILCNYEVIPVEVFEKVKRISEDKQKRKVGADTVPFDTVHLCGGGVPGGGGPFISALNHFLKISYPHMDWNWLGTTLNPFHESNAAPATAEGKGIPDDRLILKTFKNWTFLQDNTGNILNLQNFNYLLKMKTSKLDKGRQGSQVYLVTADTGSPSEVDCQEEEGQQRIHVQFAEILAGLQIVQKGGSFIMKMWTFFEAATICHLYLLCCLFEEVHLFKPAVSREGDSEVFLVCLEYLGVASVESLLKTKLVPNLENYSTLLEAGKVLLPLESIPKLFIKRIIESAQYFYGYQMKIVRRNLSTFNLNLSDLRRMHGVMKPWRKEVAEQWIEWSQIRPLTFNQRLFDEDVENFKIDRERAQLDDVDKVGRRSGTDFQKLEGIKWELMMNGLCVNWDGADYRVLIYGMGYKVEKVGFERPFTNIRCSRFCFGDLLEIREELRGIVRNYLGQLESHWIGSMRNFCGGEHETKVVYDLGSKSKLWEIGVGDLQILCFAEGIWCYATKTDFDLQRNQLLRLFDGVKGMRKDGSLFLCRFPMLTRLQTGFIFCLASLFEKIIIYGDPSKNLVGIMLNKFKGRSCSRVKNMFRCFADVLEVLKDVDRNYPCLQLVPLNLLLDFMPAEFLVKYNSLILCQDLLHVINVVECVIPTPGGEKEDGTD